MATALLRAAAAASAIAANAAAPAPVSRAPAPTATVLGYGFTSGGRAFSLSTAGVVHFLQGAKAAASPHSIVAAGACAVGDFVPKMSGRAAAAATTTTLFALTRGGNSTEAAAAAVHVVGVDVGTGDVVVHDDLPFYGGDSAEDFALGYDFYMDPCAACALNEGRDGGDGSGGGDGGDRGDDDEDTGGGDPVVGDNNARSANGTSARLVVTGPDEIQFIHVVAVEPAPGKAHYNDLLQFGGGYRLARSASTFDASRGEEWLQVVYDVSTSSPKGGAVTGQVPVAPYLKRYDVTSAAVLDVVPDVATATAMEYDAKSHTLLLVGDCPATASAAADDAENNPNGRCVYRLDPGAAGARSHIRGAGNNKAPNEAGNGKAPKMELLAHLPAQYSGLMMGGVSALDADARKLYVVAARSGNGTDAAAASGNAPRDPNDPALKCIDDTQACHRVRDAGSAGDVAAAVWDVLSIDADTGALASATALTWPASVATASVATTEDVLVCLARA